MPYKFKIGADPEFNICLQDKRVDASQIITNLFKNKFTKNKNGMGYNIEDAGSIGWDGASSTGEIRPNPSENPLEVVDNLGKMFKVFAQTTQLFELSTLSTKSSAGGHVHLEIPTGLITDINRLHKKVSSFYLPLFLGEDNLNLRIRQKGGYGQINDHREQRLNDSVTYEFRVPSAEWITTPKTAAAVLAYLFTVYNQIINHPSTFIPYKDILIKNNQQAQALQELSTTNFVYLTKTLLYKIKKIVKGFELYETYKKEIDFALNPEAMLKEKKKYGFNIMKGWKLEKTVILTKKNFLSEKTFAKVAGTVDLDTMVNAVDIPYNDDQGVRDFVNALKRRVMAFGYKLKKKYFFYGLRKSIPDYVITDKNQSFYHGQNMIKTTGDLDTILRISDRMSLSFYINNAGECTKDEKTNKGFILIGIPYSARMAGAVEHKKLIEFVYQLEKNRIKSVAPSSLLIDTSTPTKPGEIYKACNTSEETNVIAFSCDSSAESATREVEREVQVENSFNQ